MIEEDYCSYEVAKLLKEKGFDESCEQMYDGDGYLLANDCGYINEESPNEYFHALAPTLQMAMKWLMEVHNMYYEIQLLLGEKAEKYGDIKLDIYQLSSSGSYVWKDWIYADTYVELYENYIKYCLENLI